MVGYQEDTGEYPKSGTKESNVNETTSQPTQVVSLLHVSLKDPMSHSKRLLRHFYGITGKYFVSLLLEGHQ